MVGEKMAEMEEMEEGAGETQEIGYDEAFDSTIAEISGESPKEAKEPVQEEEEAAGGEEAEADEDEFKAEQYIEKPEPTEEEQEAASKDVDAFPLSWKKEDQKAWEGMSGAARAVVKRREKELQKLVNKKVSEFEFAKKRHEEAEKPLRNVLTEIEPLAKQWALSKTPLTREQGILRAVAAWEYLKSTDPIELAKEFLKASGKGPEALVSTGADKESETIRELRDQVDQVNNQLSESRKQQEAAAMQQRAERAKQVWERFANTKNAYGEHKYPSAQIPGFAGAMGSLVNKRLAEVPGSQVEEVIPWAYAQLGGQIVSGASRSSNNNTNTNELRAAATSAYNRGASGSPKQTQFDNIDDAWAATMAEFGYSE